MANPTWSEEKKAYVKSLCHNQKKIWFFSFSSGIGTLRWDLHCNQEYQILLGYDKNKDFYVAMSADPLKKNRTIKMCRALQNVDFKHMHKIQFTEQKTPYYSVKIMVIPCCELENFCKAMDYYLK